MRGVTKAAECCCSDGEQASHATLGNVADRRGSAACVCVDRVDVGGDDAGTLVS